MHERFPVLKTHPQTEVWPTDGASGRSSVRRKSHRPVSIPKVTSEVRNSKPLEDSYNICDHHASRRASQERPVAPLDFYQPTALYPNQELPSGADHLAHLNGQAKEGARTWRNSGDGKLRRARSTTLLTNMIRRRTSGNIQPTANFTVTLQGHCKMSWIGMLRRTRFLRLVHGRLYCYDARVRVLLWSVPVTGARVRILSRYRIVLSKLSTGSVVEFSVYDEISCRLWGSALLQASMLSNNPHASQTVNKEDPSGVSDLQNEGGQRQMPRSRSAVDVWPQSAFDDNSYSGRLGQLQNRHVRWTDRTHEV